MWDYLYKFPIGGPTNEFEFFMSIRYSGLLNGKVDKTSVWFSNKTKNPIEILSTILRGYLDSFFWSLNFHYSSLITHHSSLNFSHPFGIIIQFPSLNIFHTICGPILVNRCSFFFFLFSVPKLTEAIKKIIIIK